MYYCNTCQTNFKALITQDDEQGEESYSFCPNCGSDNYREGSGPEKPKHKVFIEQRKEKAFDVEAWRAKKIAEEKAQDKRIEAYQRVYAEQGPEAAQQMYFSNYNPVMIAQQDNEVNAVIIEKV